MIQTFKNLLLWNRKADDLDTWYAASSTQVYQVYSNDGPGLTLTYFIAMLNLVPYAFVWEKVNGFFRNYCTVVYDIKVGRWVHEAL